MKGLSFWGMDGVVLRKKKSRIPKRLTDDWVRKGVWGIDTEKELEGTVLGREATNKGS